jgi:hypothetical protein
MASFSQDGFQKWADTHGRDREEGFTNEAFQEGEPRVQRKPNTDKKLERTPPDVEMKAFNQELRPASETRGGYGHHEHSRFEAEDLGSQMDNFLSPQHPEHFSNESPAAMDATVAKAKKAFKGKAAPRKKKDVGQVPLLLKNPKKQTEATAVFSSGKDKTDLTPDATNIIQPGKRIYKKRPGKTLDIVLEAREEQKNLLGGRVNPLAMRALVKTLRDDPAKITDKLEEMHATAKTYTGPLKSGLKMLEPFSGSFAPVVKGAVAGLTALGLGKGGGMEEKEAGGARRRKKKAAVAQPPVGEMDGARKKKPHASKGKKSARGALVSKLMKERGVSLGEASKIIKAEGLM